MTEEAREYHRAQRPPCIVIRIRDFRKAWATAGKAAGIGGRLRHDFRHTVVRNVVGGRSWLVKRARPSGLAAVEEVLKHPRNCSRSRTTCSRFLQAARPATHARPDAKSHKVSGAGTAWTP